MTSEFRIRETEGKYYVEILSFKWSLFGIKKKWIPFVTYSGLDEIYPHSNDKIAYENLIREITINLILET